MGLPREEVPGALVVIGLATEKGKKRKERIIDCRGQTNIVSVTKASYSHELTVTQPSKLHRNGAG